MEASRLHAQAHVHAGAGSSARKLNRVGPQNVGVALEDKHWRQRGKAAVQWADTRICGVQIPRPRASRPRQPGNAQDLVEALHVRDRRVRHRDVHPRRIQDEAVHLTRSRVPSLHRQRNSQAAPGGVAEEDDSAELSLGLVNDGLDDVECVGRRVFGGERVVRNNDGQARAVDESLDDTPLPLDQRIHVGTAVQEDEDPTRAQAPLGEHTDHAAVGGRREAGAHTRWHGAGLRGVQRHLARRFLAVQRRRCHSHASVDKTHLDGHSNSFVWAAPVAVATMCTE